MKVVIKIGTSTLTYQNGCVNIRRIESLCKIVSDLMNAGNQVILVSSGAIGMGVGKLNLKERPKDIAGKQAAAAVGQCELMYIYDKEFGEHNRTVAQILLTAPDLKNEDRHEKSKTDCFRISSFSQTPVKLELSIMAKNLLIEDYPLAEKDLRKEGDRWILDTMVSGMEGVGRFVIGLAHEIRILESDELKEYIRQFVEKYLK